MKKYRDIETGEILTENDLQLEYISWLFNRMDETGREYIENNLADFSFNQFIDNCTTLWNGTLELIK